MWTQTQLLKPEIVWQKKIYRIASAGLKLNFSGVQVNCHCNLSNSPFTDGFPMSKGTLSSRLKKFEKILLESKLSLGLIYGLSFRIQAASYFPESWVQKTGLIFYLVDFHGRNCRISGFDENKTNIEPYSSLKPTKVDFIFIGPNSSRA